MEPEELDQMDLEHRDDGTGSCWMCWRDSSDPMPRPWPCDAARLIGYVRELETDIENLEYEAKESR